MQDRNDYLGTPMMDLSNYPIILRPRHVQAILGISQDATYRLMHSAATGLAVYRIGLTGLAVNREVFRRWLGYTETTADGSKSRQSMEKE